MPMDWEEKFFASHELRLEAEIRRGVDPRELDEFEEAIIDMLELTNPRAEEDVSDLDRRALELWRTIMVEDDAPAPQARISFSRMDDGQTVLRAEPPPEDKRMSQHASRYLNGLASLEARFVAKLGLYPRGRPARVRKRVTRHRALDPKRKRR